MITTLRKAQDSWITKGILILTAMSFMSLFGISGYIDSAAGNRAVIKVNDREINQQEINLQLNDEIRTAQKLFGDLEITDEIRNNMLAGLVERDLEELIVAETAARNKISVSDRQIRGIVFSQPQFMDAGGQFNREVFNYFLSQSGMSESEYHICLLLKTKLRLKDIAQLVNIALSSLSSTRSRLFFRTYGKKGSAGDWDNVIDRL